jgi:site-specific recombinase XerD
MVKRTASTGAISYSCDWVGDAIKEIHQKAGILGATAESCRRTFAVRLHQKGYDLRHINELLGHETLKATKNLIDQDPVRLGAIVAGVI